MLSRIFFRCFSASGVSLQRASMFCCIFTGSMESSRPSALKIGPNSSIDLFARVDYLFCDRRTLLRIAGEQFRAGLAFDDCASFQARLKASWIDVLDPSPFDGGCR